MDSNCWKFAQTQLGRRTSRWTVVVTIDRHGLRRPILGAILLLLSSFPSTASVTDRHRHNGPSRVSFQNTSTLGIWVLESLL